VVSSPARLNLERCIPGGPSFDFCDDLQPGGEFRQVGSAHRVAVACGSRKRREIAVGNYRLSQNLAGAVEQLQQFFASRTQRCSVLLDQVARLFKSQDRG